MAGPEDQMAEAGGHGQRRVSYADREQVIGTLKAAFVQGRLAKDEFDLRVGQTFASRTYAELAALTADLPAGLVAAAPATPARAPGGKPVLPPGRVLTAAAGLYTGAWAYVLFLAPHQGVSPWTRPLILDGTVMFLGVLIVCVSAILANRRDRRSGGQSPRRPGTDRPASRRPSPAGRHRPLPPAHRRHRHVAEAARRHRPRPPWSVRGHGADGALASVTAPASG